MSNRHIILAVTFGLLTLASGAHAQSVDMRVTGNITPEACAPVIGGGGVIDYGVIPANTLNRTDPTNLAVKSTTLTITCLAPVQVAFTIIDNRSASRVPSILAGQGLTGVAGDHANFGLGTVGTANIGGYSITLSVGQFTIDGQLAYPVVSSTDGTSWLPITTSRPAVDSGTLFSEWYSVTKLPGAVAPDAFRSMSATLDVKATINRGEVLPLSDLITLDGAATLELVYL